MMRSCIETILPDTKYIHSYLLLLPPTARSNGHRGRDLYTVRVGASVDLGEVGDHATEPSGRGDDEGAHYHHQAVPPTTRRLCDPSVGRLPPRIVGGLPVHHTQALPTMVKGLNEP